MLRISQKSSNFLSGIPGFTVVIMPITDNQQQSKEDIKRAVPTSALENFTATTSLTASKSAQAFRDELYNDIVKHPANFLANAAEGAVVGGVATALLKRPVIALPVGLGLAGWSAISKFEAASDYYHQATKASSDLERERVSGIMGHKLGHHMANSVEMLPGLIGGGYAVSKWIGAPVLYRAVGNFAEEKVMWPAKDKFAFIGPGSSRAAGGLTSPDGRIDALSVAKAFGEKHTWSGVETGQSFDVRSGRLSRTIIGDQEHGISWLPGSQKADVVTFHTHGPKAFVGPRPSDTDLLNSRGLGIIKQENNLTFYAGHGHVEVTARGRQAIPTEAAPAQMRAVVINDVEKSAVRVTGYKNSEAGWNDPLVTPLDYDKALEALRGVDRANPWSTLSAIPLKADVTARDIGAVNSKLFSWGLGSAMKR